MIAKITTAIAILRFLTEVAKDVATLVKLVQDDDVNDGVKRGKEKKEAVVNVILTLFNTTDRYVDLPLTEDDVRDTVDKLIEIFVGFYNAIGRFRSKSEE